MGGWSSKEIQEQKWNSIYQKLTEDMFGQHIAIGEVYSCLKTHFYKEDPKKALVIICNGSLGTGKTYFSSIIVNGLFEKGYSNPYVKLFVGPRDFPDPTKKTEYQAILKKTIEDTVAQNQRSFFIFDEVDKMPIGMLDKLTPYVDRYESIGGIDYRKCVFLFLSNTGGDKIDEIVLKQSAEQKPREELLLYDFRKQLNEIVLNEQGGLQGSEIIRKSLIDHFVPFLPLERQHIIACLKVEYADISSTFTSEPDFNKIAELFEYYPVDNPIFSSEGAKNVNIKIAYAREILNKGIQFPGCEGKKLDSPTESVTGKVMSLSLE